MSGMNDHIHFYVSSKLKGKIRNKAREKRETDSEFCRKKIKEGIEIDKFSKVMDLLADRMIERISEKILEEINRQARRKK